MHVADGSNNILITIKGASQLNVMMGQLEVGIVVHLISFMAIYFQTASNGPKKGVLLLCDYDFIGTMEIDSRLEKRPTSCLEVVRMLSQASVYINDVDSCTDALHSAVTESDTVMTESEACGDCLSALQLNCTPAHCLCSMNGIHFVICVTKAFPVKRLGLVGLMNECPFMTMPISKKDNSRKHI